MWIDGKYTGNIPSGSVKIAIENGHLWWIYLVKSVIFHRFFVRLPEGNGNKIEWAFNANTMGLFNGNRILGSAGLLPSSNNHIINPHVGYCKHNMSISAVYARSNRHLISAGCSLFF